MFELRIGTHAFFVSCVEIHHLITTAYKNLSENKVINFYAQVRKLNCSEIFIFLTIFYLF